MMGFRVTVGAILGLIILGSLLLSVPYPSSKTQSTNLGPADSVSATTIVKPQELDSWSYLENVGQIGNRETRFYGNIPGGSIGFACGRIFLWAAGFPGHVTLEFDRALNKTPIAVGELEYRSSFFLGARGTYTDVRAYRSIRYDGLWPGIDLAISATENGAKYRYEISPGANPSDIRVSFYGHDSLVATDTSVELTCNHQTIVDSGLMAFQNGQETPTAVSMVNEKTLSYELCGYDPTELLVIDPIIYSTGTGGSSNDEATSIAVDAEGNTYVVGQTSSADFPVKNPFDFSHNGMQDCFVTKIDPSGSLIFSTFIGGESYDEVYDIALDSEGNAYITGKTQSADFPTVNALDSTLGGGADAFVSRLSAEGNALIFSTLIGGGEGDYGYGIALDEENNVYVTGETGSADFPTNTSHPVGYTFSGNWDAFVLELTSSGNNLVFSSYFGGGEYDAGLDLAVSATDYIYVAGVTHSSDFPVSSARDPTYNGDGDCFVIMMTSSYLIFSTFIGGTLGDVANSITLDPYGRVYVAGCTESSDFPCSYRVNGSLFVGLDAFTLRLSSDGNSIQYSTIVGGSHDDAAIAIAIDSIGNAFVSGYTMSSDFPIVKAYYEEMAPPRDSFVYEIASNGTSLLFSTYLAAPLGESSYMWGGRVAVDSPGSVYVTGTTEDEGSSDVFVVKLTPDGVQSRTLGPQEMMAIAGTGIGIAVISGRIAYTRRRRRRIQSILLGITPGEPRREAPVVPLGEEAAALADESEGVRIASGVDTAGEHVKIAVKVVNNSTMSINSVTVTLDAPEGVDFSKESKATTSLGSIGPNGSFQSAIYWLTPTRCVDDSYGGTVTYQDAYGGSHKVDIPRRRIVNVCPMLQGTDSPSEIFTECKYGGLKHNSASFKFSGEPSTVFQLARARVVALVPADFEERRIGDHVYLGYTCVVGKTKYGNKRFAAEIQVSGNPSGGALTIRVYSDDDSILSGFFVDIMTDVREHVRIIEERSQIRSTECANCGASLDLTGIDESRTYTCGSCGSSGKVPPWWG